MSTFDVNKLNEKPPYADFVRDRSKIRYFKDKKEILSENYDAIVIGAGPIGAATATVLARDGRKILVVERSWNMPERFVGELMQPGGIKAMEALGLADVFYGIGAVKVDGYYVGFKSSEVYIPYNTDKETGARLQGASFHHGEFLMNIRAACKAETNVTCLEAEVSELVKSPDLQRIVGVVVTESKGFKDTEAYLDNAADNIDEKKNENKQYSIYAPLVIVVDGIYSKFRADCAVAKKVKPRLISHFVAFTINHEKENPLPRPNNGHVFLQGFTPILMYQMTDTETRVLVDVPGLKLPSQASGALRKYITAAGHHLPEKVKEAYLSDLEKTKRLKVMTNSSLPSHKVSIYGAAFVGDSYNMRHPLTGAGMTVGMWDVYYLTKNLSRSQVKSFTDSKAVLEALDHMYDQRRARALVLNVLSVALYSLFAADNDHYRNLRDACFQYFQLGGDAIDGPSGLLSGTITNPIVLAYHFFAVAIYAMFLEICKAKSATMILPHFFKSLYTLFVAAYIFIPLLLEEILPS
ncbi:hypothetical protein BB560_003078 [Smittium megazygosporum]|uniref:Squalene monooxygenase n=1 Tax=Smittium megazygosporum TaxID=133381 RepID=A0A2T9ZD16_9FUNG|nr:hypothetical protein BB560_003078 [Smittium megazygosporum]